MVTINIQRYYVSPPTEAEMAAALQDGTGSAVNDSAHQDEAAVGPLHVPSAQIAQQQNSIAETEVVGCCGFVLVCRRPTSQ